MNELDLKRIWKSAQAAGDQQKKYTMEEILMYRKRQSRETSRGILWGIKSDIALKAVLLFGFGVLLLILPVGSPGRPVALVLIGLILALIFLEFHFIRKLDQLGETDAILNNLKNKIGYLRHYYRPYIFIGALTNPILMLCGFFFYFYFTYGEIRMAGPAEDPVLYLLLLLGYALGVIGTYPFYLSRNRDLTECLHDLDEDDLATQKIAGQQYRKRRFLIIAFILILLGLLLFLFLLFY